MQTKFYLTMKPLLIPFIQKLLGNDTTEELIMTVAGILDTNCFEIILMAEQIEAGGLFMLSLILHHTVKTNFISTRTTQVTKKFYMHSTGKKLK
jgi:hypothetical protein